MKEITIKSDSELVLTELKEKAEFAHCTVSQIQYSEESSTPIITLGFIADLLTTEKCSVIIDCPNNGITRLSLPYDSLEENNKKGIIFSNSNYIKDKKDTLKDIIKILTDYWIESKK